MNRSHASRDVIRTPPTIVVSSRTPRTPFPTHRQSVGSRAAYHGAGARTVDGATRGGQTTHSCLASYSSQLLNISGVTFTRGRGFIFFDNRVPALERLTLDKTRSLRARIARASYAVVCDFNIWSKTLAARRRHVPRKRQFFSTSVFCRPPPPILPYPF